MHDSNAPSPYGIPAGGIPGGSRDRAEVSEMAVEMLRGTRPWVMFLSVMSFIGSAFMLLAAVIVMIAGALAPKNSSPIPMAVLGLFYLPMALLYIYPALKLWSYGSAIGRLVTSRSSYDLELALGQQKSFWKFAGILTIVMIVLYIVMFIGMAMVGMAASSGR